MRHLLLPALLALLAGCAGSSARDESASTAATPAASIAVAPPPQGPTTLPELPEDALVILITGKNAYTVQDATTSCEGLADLLKHYRQSILVVAGTEGAAMTVADAICVGLAAKQRGGKAYMAHPDGLRSIDIQN